MRAAASVEPTIPSAASLGRTTYLTLAGATARAGRGWGARSIGDTGAVRRAIDDARAAFERHDWSETHRLLAGVPVDELSADDLDRFAAAAYLTGREETACELWARAHRDCVRTDRVELAARFGLRLAQAMGFKGDIGRSAGWVERVRRLLDDAGVDCVELGYLAHAAAFCRIFGEGDFAGAHELFVQAGTIGARYRDRELVTLARIGEGRMLVYLGSLVEGVALLDEAMIAVEAREISPIAVGDAYCTVIDACTEIFDMSRCGAWTESFSRWCDEHTDLVLYRGNCLLHRAQVLYMLGDWSDAAEAARSACARLAQPINSLTLGGAHYVEGELHRLRGEFDAAEASYRSANQYGCEPQPGLARMRLAQGRTDTAAASIQRVLDEAVDPIARARVLGAYAEIMLAAGDVSAARAAAEELTAVAAQLGSPFLRARAAHATGAALLAEGRHKEALQASRRALQQWTELEAPHEAALTRVVTAEACAAVGDAEGAELAKSAARFAFEHLGAVPDLAQLDADDLPDRPDGLTSRELEVLRVLAQGKTNRVIAQNLFISEKTVASHVSHIFTKLGVSSRAAATAYAYDHDLA
jgi:DNA-binding CsgD family transcriptional regulator/tetratricopeptide (TPR) repeat protein